MLSAGQVFRALFLTGIFHILAHSAILAGGNIYSRFELPANCASLFTIKQQL